MILITRGLEHPELPAVRRQELARVRAIVQSGRAPVSKEIGVDYKCARGTLRDRQYFKCCYCEKFDEEKHTTVEHVRPKTEARRSNGRIERGYWWLAWSWGNLLFCCKQCNGNKGIWYPLRGDEQPPHFGRPLQEDADPPGQERPLLLDPTQDDGIVHIQFRLVSGRWIPLPRNGSIRGYETIRRVQLDRANLLELYEKTVSDLRDCIERIRGEISRAVKPPSSAVVDTWGDVMRRHLRAGAVLAGLRYDVFDYFFPKTVRSHWGISLDTFAASITHRRTGA